MRRGEIMLRIVFLQLMVSFLALGINCGFCFEEDLSAGAYESDQKLERLQIYFEAEMYEEATNLLNELITEFPEEPRFVYLRAIVDYQQEDYSSAEGVFLDFVQQYPEVAEPYYLLGEINLKTGNKDEARKHLAKYCELVPEDYDAYRKLQALDNHLDEMKDKEQDVFIIKDGMENLDLVKKVGYYGACVHRRQTQSIKLINGSFRTWSAMGIDFVYPLDLRGKHLVLRLKGKCGGEKLELTFRDKFASGYEPQLRLETKEKGLSRQWQRIKVDLSQVSSCIDLSQVVHIGLEFGFSTVRNPANSTLFVKDIAIEPRY